MQSLPFSKIKDVSYTLQESGVFPASEIADLLYTLQKCGKQGNFLRALRLHAYMCKCGLEALAVLGNCLLEMWVEVGSLMHAQMVFNKLLKQEECSWNCLITGYIDCGELKQAHRLYNMMRRDYGLCPSARVFVALLKSCTLSKDLQTGNEMHEDIIKEGLLEGNVFLGSALVSMYVKCGKLSMAEMVFNKLVARNVVLWNSIIAGFAEHGYGREALQSLDGMQQECIFPDAVTLVCCLKACSNVGAMKKGLELHAKIDTLGLLQSDIFVGNALIDMHAKLGSFDKAKEIFSDLLCRRNLVSWNALIAGYADNGHGEEALTCFERMQQEAISSDAITLVCGLKACGSVGDLSKGQEIHGEITKKGFLESDAFTGTALVDMYMKCDMCEIGHHIFNELPFQDVVSWNAIIAGQVECGHYEEALVCLDCMRLDGICPDPVTFGSCLKACSSIGCAHKGQEIHTEAVKTGLESYPLVGSTLIDMYFKSRRLVDAQQVFEKLPNRPIAAWNSLMAGYIEHRLTDKALDLFKEMQNIGVAFDALTLINSLKACGGSAEGQEIHALIVQKGLWEKDIYVHSTLVDMYAKCGMLIEAQKVFNQTTAQDVVSWTALISGYVEHGQPEEALASYDHMQREGVHPEPLTIICILKACSNLKLLQKGYEIHMTVIRKGLLERESFICSALMDMYAKCGSLLLAQEVFNTLQVRDVASWTVLMLGFLESGDGDETLRCLEQMLQEKVSPNLAALTCSMKACSSLSNASTGREIHSEALKKGFERDSLFGNALLDMYCRCGCFEEAQKLYIELPYPFSWAALMAGYTDRGENEEAIYCYQQMKLEGVSPCMGSYISCLKACGSIQAVIEGLELHSEAIKKGYDDEVIVANAVVDMYIKCGLLTEAQKIFENVSTQSVVLWNALIQGYADNKGGKEAMDLFERMKQKGISPDMVTFMCGLKACGMTGAAAEGQEIHEEVTNKGLETEISICNTLVDMYAKCGLLGEAQETFGKLPDRDTVSWTALISGHVGHGYGEEALCWLDRMQHENMMVNSVTLVCCLKACGSVGAALKGRNLHIEIIKKGLEKEVTIGNTLVDMYSRCGLLAIAQEVFDKLCVRDLISWNALIAGYAQLGESGMVFYVFELMRSENIEPSLVTFISILNVCSHAGLLDSSRAYFDAISDEFNLTPSLEHYTCMVDTVGRAGCVEEAMAMAGNMPMHPGIVMWHTVLGACAKGANVELARLAYEHIVGLDETDCAAYICLSNIYAAAALQEGCEQGFCVYPSRRAFHVGV